MPKALIFDIDGTLIDSVDLHAKSWQRALAHFGHEVAFDEVRQQIGKGGDQLMPVFLSEAEIERYGEDLEAHRTDLFRLEFLPAVRAFPDVRALFERARADGKRLVLASSAKGEELARYKELAEIGDLVEAETSSDDAEKSKPHPDIFAASLGELGDIDPSEAIVIGDTPYDAEAAGKLGLRTVGLLCGGFPEDQLRQAGCVAIYADPADLLAHYDESPLAG